MNWNRLRHDWQYKEPAAAVELPLFDRLQKRERRLHRRVRLRDAIETIVALLIAPFFGVASWFFFSHGLWLTTAGALLLTLWCLFVPWKLRQARKLKPRLHPEVDLLSYLHQERQALQAQYHLLDGIIGWYLGPAAVGVLAFYLGVKGLSWDSAVYTAAVLFVYGLIYIGNRAAAHKQLRPQIESIDREILDLQQENGS